MAAVRTLVSQQRLGRLLLYLVTAAVLVAVAFPPTPLRTWM